MGAPEVKRGFDVPTAPPVQAVDPGSLIGTWLNYDASSSGIARLEISGDDACELGVRIFGVDSPVPRDWGVLRGEAFAAGVQGGLASGLRAQGDFGFMEVLVVAYLNLRLLVVDTYNIFRDGSGRAPYFMRDHFFQK